MTCTCGNSFDYSKKAVNAPANNNAAANIGDRL